jgi:hypothetical protein
LAKAIFFANNQEIQEGEKEEQDLSAACKMLIQNAIVLWNYLYLSEYLANFKDLDERMNAAQSILNGSVLTWRHINLHGEYDFSQDSANDDKFALDKILALTIGLLLYIKVLLYKKGQLFIVIYHKVKSPK